VSKRSNLTRAKTNKKDEFYTQLKDIENELKHYKDHFKDKVVYCNADDPRVSNFFHYFSYNFEYLGLKKLITTCYQNQEMDLFSMHDMESAIALVYEGEKDKGRIPTVENIGVIELKGDGDFRSPEAIEFLKEADIVVTNPPFSLFREYVAQLVEYEKDFIIMGNNNAITYKEVFPLIRDEKLWLGHHSNKTIEFMLSPEYEKWDRVDEEGNKYGKVPAISWFTNLDTPKRHEEIILYRSYSPEEYPKYDNCNAINVDRVTEIPKDYYGVIGVPITYLGSHNPDQFEIIGITKTWDNFASKTYPRQTQISSNGRKSIVTKLNDGGVLKLDEAPQKGTYYMIDENIYIQKYARILIKPKKVVE